MLDQLLRRARRRAIGNIIFEQSMTAASAGLVGAVLLLLVGTQILDWYWPIGLAVLAAVVVWMGARRHIPTLYTVAQRVDRRLALSDTLSTALNFRERAHASSEFVACQERQAEAMARSVDVRAAAPWRFPRSAWTALALAVAVLGLLGFRYGVLRSLDLRTPLVEGLFDSPRTQWAQNQNRAAEDKRIHQQLDALGVSIEQGEAGRTPVDDAGAPDSALSSPDIPDVNDIPKESAEAGQRGTSSQQPSEEGGQNEESESAAAGAQNAADEQPDGGKSPSNQNPAAKQSPQAGENSSLMDKLRDAMANFMSKMKIPQRTGEGKQMASSQQGGQQFSRPQQGGQQRGERTQGDQKQGAANADHQGEREGEGGQNAQGAQGQPGDQGSDRASQQDAKSGIGKQDGAKDIKESGQLAAMGKISEIFGRRAANLTGDVLVETPSGKQQLRTPYAQRGAVHAEAGADIHRDEIPLIYQRFVQQYFEEIRKQPVPQTKHP